MDAKTAYLAFHGIPAGTPEAERAWAEKQALDRGEFRGLAPMVFVGPDICYDSPIDGRPVTSAAARREDLARSGCIEYEPGMRQDAERRREEGERNLDRSVDQFVEREIATMPSRKRERLAAELQGGITAGIERITPAQKSFRGE